MKRIKEHLIPALVLILFILIMNSGELLKKPFNNEDDVNRTLRKVEENIINEQWQQADKNLDNLQHAWAIVEKRVQFVTEKDALEKMNANLSRLQGTIISQDRTSAIIELSELKLIWEKL